MPCMKSLLITFLLTMSLAALTACEQEGPMERAGERTDRAIDDANEAIDEAGDDLNEAIDRRQPNN